MGKAKKENPYLIHRIILYGRRVYTVFYVLILLIFFRTWCGSYRPYIGVWEVLLILVGGAVCLALNRLIGGISWRWRGIYLWNHKGILGTLVRRPKKRLLILFGFFTTTGVIVHTVNLQPMVVWMQQWQLPYVFILIGVITAFVYLWWGSNTLSPEQSINSGSSTLGGFVSGLFLALGLSLFYHYQFLDDPYSLGWLLLLWVVLSGGLWRLKTQRGMMHQTANQLRRKRRNFQQSPWRVQPYGKTILQVSLVVGLFVSIVSLIRSLVPDSPFYQATGSLYQAARALPYLQSPNLVDMVFTVNSFVNEILITTLANPWLAFFLMGFPATVYLRYLTRIEKWYKHHTLWETTIGRILAILKPIAVWGALGVNVVSLFLMIVGSKIGVSSFALCLPMIFTFPFSIIYYGYHHAYNIGQVELEGSTQRSVISIGMFCLLLVVFLTSFFNPPVSSEQTEPSLPTDTSFEGYVAETAMHLYNPVVGGFVMQEGIDEPNLQATYYGIQILQTTGRLNRLEGRPRIERFVMGYHRENGQFGEGIEDTYYAVSILNSLKLLSEEIKGDVERYLHDITAFPLSLEEAYSNDVGVAYWGIRICRELGLPLASTLGLQHYGEDDLYVERKPLQRQDTLHTSPIGGEQFAVSVDVLEAAVIPAFFVSPNAAIPRLEFKMEFATNETVLAELLHDGMALEQRTVDGCAGDGTVFSVPFPKAGQYAIGLTRPDVKSYVWVGDEDGSGGAFEWQFNRQATPTPFLITVTIPCFDVIPFSVAYDLAILIINSTSSFDLLITDSGDRTTYDSSQNFIEQLTFEGVTNETASVELEKNAYNLVILTETPEDVDFAVHQREFVSEPLGTYLTQDAPLVQFNQGLDAYSRLEDLARLAFVYGAISEPGYEQYVYDREYVLRTLMKHYNTTSHLFERDGHIAESYWGAVAYAYLEQGRILTDIDGSSRSPPKSATVAARKKLMGSLAAADTALLSLHKQWYHEANLTDTRKGIAFLSSIPHGEWDQEWDLASTYFGVRLARQIGEVQHALAFESSRPSFSIRPTPKVAAGGSRTSSLYFDRTTRFDFKQALGFSPIYSKATSFVRLGRPLQSNTDQDPYLFQKRLLALSLVLCMSFAFPFQKRDLVKFWALVFLGLFFLQLPAVVGTITENAKELFQQATDRAAWRKFWDRLLGKTENADEKRVLTTFFSWSTRIYEPILKPALWSDIPLWLYNVLAGSGGVPRWQPPTEQIPESDDKSLSSSLRPQELNPQEETQAQTDVNPVSIVFPTLFLQRCGILSEVSIETLIRVSAQRSYFTETSSADSFKEIRFEVSNEDLAKLLGEVNEGRKSEASLTQYAVFVDEDRKEHVVRVDSLDLERHPELQTLHKLNVLLGYVLEQSMLLRDAVEVAQATNALHTTDLFSSLQGKEIVLSADLMTREIFLNKLLSNLECQFHSDKFKDIRDFMNAEFPEIWDLLFGKEGDSPAPFMLVQFRATIRNQDGTASTALPVTAGGFLLNTGESLDENLAQLGERYARVLTAQRKALVVLVHFLAAYVTGEDKTDYELELDQEEGQRFLELLSAFQPLFTRLEPSGTPVDYLCGANALLENLAVDANLHREIIVFAPNARPPAAVLTPDTDGASLLHTYLTLGNGLVMAGQPEPFLQYDVAGLVGTPQNYETGNEFPGVADVAEVPRNPTNLTLVVQQFNITEPLIFREMTYTKEKGNTISKPERAAIFHFLLNPIFFVFINNNIFYSYILIFGF